MILKEKAEEKEQDFLEIQIKRNIRSKRIVLIDKKTRISLISFDKKSFVAEFLEHYYNDKIMDFKPIKIK
jgi:hypothetical protein